MKVEDFNYELPEELIAQTPLKERDECRLMVLHKSSLDSQRNAHPIIEHRVFKDVLEYLNPGDCLVLNDSRVIPARLYGTKEGTGANIEYLLIKRLSDEQASGFGCKLEDGDEIWETMVRPGRRLKVGDRVVFSDLPGKNFSSEILAMGEGGTRIVRFSYDGIFMERLEELGAMPLPPYISRPATEEDREDYQTVYNRLEGSVAAPTAGLHFTKELLDEVEAKGIRLAYLTLHVGIGTFRPVKADNVEEHHMHFEEYTVPQEACNIINDTIKAGGKIVSVGTTSTRTLESVAVFDEELGQYIVKAGSGSTGIFIYPGYEFKVVDGLITNFHLPKSSLIMLVSALYDREKILMAYREAVKEKYRFFSYGDAMIII